MNSEGKKVAFHTLGCKLNFSESSTIARLFEKEGFNKVSFSEEADVYVINTCSVTENADKECKSIVKSALHQNPDAFIAVVGCYAQLKPEEIAKIEGVDVVLGATEKFKLLNYINNLDKKANTEVINCEIEDATFFIGSYSVGDRTRSFLKVQDGCDYTCSFCTIPLARGRSRSDTIENAVLNARKIATEGIKEIVLTGVNLGDFGNGLQVESKGINRKEIKFIDLVKELDEIEEIKRFRISSIEPNLLTDEIISFVSQSTKFVPHFHIPLQSGSNKTLKNMRRRYLRELYADRVQSIKMKMPDCCIGVDVIVGFPGETEEDFLETYNFLQSLDVSYLHVFTYSERDNTDAKKMKGSVSIAERKKRNKMLRILSAKKQRYFYESQANRMKTVLFESENKEGFIFGFTDNYIKVKSKFRESLSNQLIDVKLTEIDAEGIYIVTI